MSFWIICLLIVYAVLMSCGQILFKLAANSGAYFPKIGSAFAAYLNPYFLIAITLYFGLTVFWIWLIKFVPLSKAYPIVAISFVVTPLLAQVILAENLPKDLLVGSFLIITGIYLITR